MTGQYRNLYKPRYKPLKFSEGKMGKVSVVSLLSCLLLLRLNCVKSNTPLAPALYVFGDSLVDGGNNNYLQSYAKANYPPYGKSFWNGQASGRFTNGKTPTDYIAEFLKLPWPPAILSLSDEWRKKTITGVNYASAGCGIIPETGVQLGCMNFDKQIDLFTRTVNNDLPNQYKTSKELSDHLAKSIFVVIIGSNDYLNYYLMAPMKSKHITSKAFATSLIGELSNRLEVNNFRD
ncbi:hypothetical protein GIB67_036485 [Kingdonia uniflora]|uniref:GDSL esterase/lipase n=1 Tax=Kingdonia uniflora TaxID=39325 RepID=A0A7J7P8B1_9MAGN|nr:hypothetical protein GIB67_036485 [Kingdonia uniflora]